jgi:hypothetical protein
MYTVALKVTQLVLCPFFSVMEPESHDPGSPFSSCFVGLDSSGLIIHPLWTALVDITKEYMIRRKDKPIADEVILGIVDRDRQADHSVW